MNELGSVDELFSLDKWAKNLLGLIVVLVLLGLTLGMTAWSFGAYIRSLRLDGRAVPVDGVVATTVYARSLLASSYKRAACLRKIGHDIRTKTHCGPILCHLHGDPFGKYLERPCNFLLCGLLTRVLARCSPEPADAPGLRHAALHALLLHPLLPAPHAAGLPGRGHRAVQDLRLPELLQHLRHQRLRRRNHARADWSDPCQSSDLVSGCMSTSDRPTTDH
jgi:hypothetical protein